MSINSGSRLCIGNFTLEHDSSVCRGSPEPFRGYKRLNFSQATRPPIRQSDESGLGRISWTRPPGRACRHTAYIGNFIQEHEKCDF
jgi:hypothetical protein